MSIICVLGATGSQGGSVCTALQDNPRWKVRAVTRSPGSVSSKKLLDQGIEVVSADANDEPSLVKAFQGASAVFALTNFDWNLVMKVGREAAGEAEKQQQINIAKAAAQIPSLEHYVMSSLPPASLSSSGKLPVPHFWRQRLLASGWPGSDAYAWIQPSRRDAVLPIAGDVQHNVGVVVKGILEAGPRAFGKVAIVITDYLKMPDVVQVWERVSGRKGVFLEASDETVGKVWGVGGLEIAVY